MDEIECDEIFPTKLALENAASETSQNAPEEYRHSVYLYFIARYLVALYEIEFGAIPLQVWNEYRNALDHFFRYIADSDNPKDQLDSMERHLQRAVLDVSKIYCHDSSDRFKILLNDEDHESLRLVDNGSFYGELTTTQSNVTRCFIEAKTADSKLGMEEKADKEVLSKYLDAVYGFRSLRNIMIDRREDIDRITFETGNLKARTEKETHSHAFKSHILASLAAKIIYAFFLFIATFVGVKYNAEISNAWATTTTYATQLFKADKASEAPQQVGQ